MKYISYERKEQLRDIVKGSKTVSFFLLIAVFGCVVLHYGGELRSIGMIPAVFGMGMGAVTIIKTTKLKCIAGISMIALMVSYTAVNILFLERLQQSSLLFRFLVSLLFSLLCLGICATPVIDLYIRKPESQRTIFDFRRANAKR
jgi:NADH:ubiquinone oxidoreductase subunit 2 (subunit N)